MVCPDHGKKFHSLSEDRCQSTAFAFCDEDSSGRGVQKPTPVPDLCHGYGFDGVGIAANPFGNFLAGGECCSVRGGCIPLPSGRRCLPGMPVVSKVLGKFIKEYANIQTASDETEAVFRLLWLI